DSRQSWVHRNFLADVAAHPAGESIGVFVRFADLFDHNVYHHVVPGVAPLCPPDFVIAPVERDPVDAIGNAQGRIRIHTFVTGGRFRDIELLQLVTDTK